MATSFNNITSRSDAGALVPEEVSTEMMGKAVDQSAVLQLFRRIPVARNAVRFPVLSALPVAYWVSGDTGLKGTTEVNWANKYMNIEEMATIMPVPDNVIDDIDANIWDESMPLLTEALGRLLDSTVLFGNNAPSSFPTNVVTAATNAGNTVTEGSAATAGGYFGDIDKLYGFLDTDGFDVTGWMANTTAKGKMRTPRDSQGRKLDPGRVDANMNALDGYPLTYPIRGGWPTASGSPRLLGGDWTQFVVGVRKDVTLKILTEAVIQDNTGAIIYNLAQQDMTAIRLTFRIGWQVSNRINNDNPDPTTRYPVAGLLIP